jgi:hypothetical protein
MEIVNKLMRYRPKRNLSRRHSGAMRSIEPGISRFPDAQLRICDMVLRAIPE